jgi:hypothetical protein
VHALAAGVAAVDTEFVAICDADTLYPPAIWMQRPRGWMQPRSPPWGSSRTTPMPMPDSLQERAGRWLYTYVIPEHSQEAGAWGGYAHLMRTAPFKASGGYSAALWPYVLKDHELVHRLTKQGDIRYATDLWVRPSDRRADRKGVRWTLYRAHPLSSDTAVHEGLVLLRLPAAPVHRARAEGHGAAKAELGGWPILKGFSRRPTPAKAKA